VGLGVLPLSANGKVDRHALAAIAQRHNRQDHGAATHAAELGRIWSSILAVSHIHPRDNFFELGGDSLQAIEVVMQAEQRLRVAIPFHALFESASFADFVSTVEGLGSNRTVARAGRAFDARGSDGAYALSPAQDLIWTLDEVQLDGDANNAPLAVELDGPLDVSRLAQAVGDTVDRHAILHARFALADGQPVQMFDGRRIVRMEITDLSALAPDEQRHEVEQRISAELSRPFDLRDGPATWIELLVLGRNRHVLLLTAHHLLVDDGSLMRLYREIASRYSGDMGSIAPATATDYPVFARWHREWVASRRAVTLPYWIDVLRCTSNGTGAVEAHGNGASSDSGRSHRFTSDQEVSAAVTALARQTGTTPFIVLLSALAIVFGNHHRRKQFLIATDFADRSHPATTNLVGLFLNVVLIPIDLSGVPTFRELLTRVRGGLREALKHADCPYQWIADAWRSLGHDTDPYSVMLVMLTPFQGRFADAIDARYRLGTVDGFPGGHSPEFYIRPTPSGLSGVVEYDAARIERTTVERWLTSLETIVRVVTTNPDSDVRLWMAPD
jgi:acyl carrier protein